MQKIIMEMTEPTIILESREGMHVLANIQPGTDANIKYTLYMKSEKKNYGQS